MGSTQRRRKHPNAVSNINDCSNAVASSGHFFSSHKFLSIEAGSIGCCLLFACPPTSSNCVVFISCNKMPATIADKPKCQSPRDRHIRSGLRSTCSDYWEANKHNSRSKETAAAVSPVDPLCELGIGDGMAADCLCAVALSISDLHYPHSSDISVDCSGPLTAPSNCSTDRSIPSTDGSIRQRFVRHSFNARSERSVRRSV